jgi:hypothetical protein
MYHIPMVDSWLQAGALSVPGSSVWYNAGNSELLGLWAVAPFSGDFWIPLSGLPACVLLGLGIYQLSGQAGIRPILRHATTAAVLGTSVVETQLTSIENDVAGAGLFVAAVVYSLRFAKSAHTADAAFAGMAIGLLAGVKYYALGYAVVCSCAPLPILVRRQGWRSAGVWLLCVAVGVLALGGYWYLRNFLLTGTPVYPLGFSAGTDRLQELRPGSWSSSLLGNGRASLLPLYALAVWTKASAIYLVALLALPALYAWALMSGWISCETSDGGVRKNTRVTLSLLLPLSCLIFSITPYVVDAETERMLFSTYLAVRFSLCPLSLSVLLLSVACSDLTVAPVRRRGWFRVAASLRMLPAALLTAAATVLLGGKLIQGWRADAILCLLLAASLSFIAYALINWVLPVAAPRCGRILVPIGLSAIAAVLSFENSKRWHRDFAINYDQQFGTIAFSQMNEAGLDRRPVVCSLFYRCYPLYGSRRQYWVLRPERVESDAAMRQYLVEQRVELVCTETSDSRRFGRYGRARQWATTHQAVLQRVASGRTLQLYRVNLKELSQNLALAESDSLEVAQ